MYSNVPVLLRIYNTKYVELYYIFNDNYVDGIIEFTVVIEL